MAIIIDGRQASRDIRDELRAEALKLKAATGIVPGLAVILVGENPASRIYVGGKEKACQEAGFLSRVFRLPAETENPRHPGAVASSQSHPARCGYRSN
jgi:methylenetetrahydrofolate dehydrogenase (NADP+)/methenyltetrahydrofolate cyclohydrolase